MAYHKNAKDPDYIANRFWSKVDKEGPVAREGLTPCWVWTGHKNSWGYGRFSLENKAREAHRVVWLLTTGQWPARLLLHSCDNPACVRPDHMREGTDAENAADMVARGRSLRGRPRSPNYKRTAYRVMSKEQREAAADCRARGDNVSELAREWGLNESTVQTTAWLVLRKRAEL